MDGKLGAAGRWLGGDGGGAGPKRARIRIVAAPAAAAPAAVPAAAAVTPERPAALPWQSTHTGCLPKAGGALGSSPAGPSPPSAGASPGAGTAPGEGGFAGSGGASASFSSEPVGRDRHPLLDGCRRVERFKKLNLIDEGTYGVVHRARDVETGEVVALKQLKLNAARSDDGFPISSLREISILLLLVHPNVVRCREVVVGVSSSHIFMVMEYVEHELKVLINNHRFSIAEMKCLLRQLVDGVHYIHEMWVVHRDLKTTNILLNNSGVLKVCDFGLARHYGDPLRPYTQRVQSLWYRAPELLLGQRRYDSCVDVWSIGCIFGELLLRKPLFDGKVELHQLGLIFEMAGVPTEDSWPGCKQLPNWRVVKFKLSLPRWRHVFPEEEGNLSDTGLDLLRSLCEVCPERRLTAGAAHKHPYFWEAPFPQEPSMMPTFLESNSEGRRLPDRVKRLGPKGAAVGAAAAALGAAPAGVGGGLGGLMGAGLRGSANRGGPPPLAKLRVGE